jgi:hypothetical protein
VKGRKFIMTKYLINKESKKKKPHPKTKKNSNSKFDFRIKENKITTYEARISRTRKSDTQS